MSITDNEWEIPSPTEAATKEARRNIERSKMHVLDKTEWPDGAEGDDLLYSLECSRAQTAEFVDGEFVWTDVDAQHSEFAQEKPPLTPITGTYAEVSRYAVKMNSTQGNAGAPVHWRYTPVLITKLAA